MRNPDLFIVGAPKSGTTSMYSYLKGHPDIFMSSIKEPQFFAIDIFRHQRSVRNLNEYMKCFEGARGEKRVGEASTGYLGSPNAAHEIREFCPQARIIVMLRNPVDVMQAQHSERIFSRMEHIRDFEAAINSQETRYWRTGPYRGEPVRRLGYRELCRFSVQLERYFDVFGRDNVHVIVFEDLTSDCDAVFAKTLQFLDLSPRPHQTGEVLNRNRRARSARMQGLLEHPPASVRHLAHVFLPKSLRKRFGFSLQKLNTIYEPRKPIKQSFRILLQREYEQEIDRLSLLLDRDLTAWYRT